MIHRDIKPENLLLNGQGDVLLSDFGTSTGMSDMTTRHHQVRQTMCGTPEYMAPEMLHHQPYTENVDIWAVGVVAYELLVGQPPMRQRSGAWEEGENLVGDISAIARDFIGKVCVCMWYFPVIIATCFIMALTHY